MIILAVIIGLSLLILAHEWGHFIAAKMFGVKVEEFGFGYPPRLAGKKIGETLYSVNLLPFGGFVRIHGEDVGGATGGAESVDPARSFVGKPAWKRAVILLAGVLMNVLVGWVILTGVFLAGAPEHLLISGVASDSPAAEAGIAPGDVVMKIQAGEVTLADPVESDAFVNAVGQGAGTPVSVTVSREGELIDFSLVPRANPPEGEGALGVMLSGVGFPRESFFGALGNGFVATASILWLTVRGFVDLIVGIFVTPATALQGVAGPVGIFNLAAETGKLGAVYLAELMALISLNLAVLNTIPFPALDGGRTLFLLIEKLRGKPVGYMTQRAINTLGFVALIVLMVFVTVHDVGSLL